MAGRPFGEQAPKHEPYRYVGRHHTCQRVTQRNHRTSGLRTHEGDICQNLRTIMLELHVSNQERVPVGDQCQSCGQNMLEHFLHGMVSEQRSQPENRFTRNFLTFRVFSNKSGILQVSRQVSQNSDNRAAANFGKRCTANQVVHEVCGKQTLLTVRKPEQI